MFTKVKDAAPREPMMPPATAMPKKSPRAAPSIVSADMTIVGAITAGGDIQVDGTVEGDICAESLTVGEKAIIKGEILAEEVIVRGIVEGSIRAEKVQLCAGARVHGDLLHAGLAVETGALFEGNSRHSEDPLGRKTGGKPVVKDAPAPATSPVSATPERTYAAAPDAAPMARDRAAPQSPPAGAGSADSPVGQVRPRADELGAAETAPNGQENKTPGNAPASRDLSNLSPGKMRAGGDGASQSVTAKPK